MGEGRFDEAKGRAKETIGHLTGNERLETEGKADRSSGSLKDRATDVVDKVRDKVREVVGRNR